MSSVGEVVDRLKIKAKPGNLEEMAKYGMAVEQRLGVSVPDMRQIAKELGKNHQLALELWNTGIAEAKIVAALVDDPKKLTDEQKLLLEEGLLSIEEASAAEDEAFEEVEGNLAEFLNTALNDYPDAPETQQALDIYSIEAILVAEDMVTKAGDYSKAIDHLYAAGSLYDQVGLDVYSGIDEKIAWLNDWRFITQERFDSVNKGMTKDEVKVLAGVPYYQNIQKDTKRDVETWLYRKVDGGAAAIYFKMKTDKVYTKNFDAIKTKVVE